MACSRERITMNAVRIAVIGANTANIREIKDVVVATIGDNVEIVTASINNYRKVTDADLYICLINRKQEVVDAFGAEKVVAMTLVPPTEYFLEIAKIPAGETVIIFNNSTGGTKVLRDLLAKYSLTHVHYQVIPYDEWSEQAVAEKLATARYITGGVAYVAEGRALYKRFGHYIPKDAVVLVSPPRMATAESVSNLARIFGALYHKSVTEELQKLASLDYLTQIPNRRTFDENLMVECGRARREGYPLLLAMIDIDFFKPYNDHYGHIAGDECLRAIARRLRSMMRRPADFCARYGGEEFAVILPDTDADGGTHVLEEIRQAIFALEIRHGFSAIAPFVTVSIGAAVDTMALEANLVAGKLLARADVALYQAKQQGRNKTFIWRSG